MQDHRPAPQRLQFGHLLVAVDDLGVAVHREVGVIPVQPQRLISRVGQQVGHRGHDRRQLGRVVAAMAEHVEEDLEDAVFDLGVPLRGKIRIRRLHRRHLGVAVFPRRQDGHEQVVAAPRHVGPPGRPHVIHRDFESVGPEQVQRHVPHQLELALIAAGLDALEDVGTGGRFGVEVAAHHRIELLEAVEGGEVEIGKTIGRKHDLAVLVHFIRMH